MICLYFQRVGEEDGSNPRPFDRWNLVDGLVRFYDESLHLLCLVSYKFVRFDQIYCNLFEEFGTL